MSLLVLCEILRLFVNALTADDKYSLRYRENSPQPIQMQSFKQQQTFSEFLAASLKSTSKFENLEEKDDFDSSCIS